MLDISHFISKDSIVLLGGHNVYAYQRIQLEDLEEKIKVRGGEKCSKTGYWTTLAQPNEREYFNRGDILPMLLEQDWGEVYWYLDDD